MRSLRTLIGTRGAERIWITSRWEAWLDEDGAAAGKPVNQAATLLARPGRRRASALCFFIRAPERPAVWLAPIRTAERNRRSWAASAAWSTASRPWLIVSRTRSCIAVSASAPWVAQHHWPAAAASVTACSSRSTCALWRILHKAQEGYSCERTKREQAARCCGSRQPAAPDLVAGPVR